MPIGDLPPTIVQHLLTIADVPARTVAPQRMTASSDATNVAKTAADRRHRRSC